MKNRIAVIVILALIVGTIAFSVHSCSASKPSEKKETTKDLKKTSKKEPEVVTTVNIPNASNPNDADNKVVDGDGFYHDRVSSLKFLIPGGYKAKSSNDVIYFVNKSTKSQIAMIRMTEFYQTSDILDSAPTYMPKIAILKEVKQFDTQPVFGSVVTGDIKDPVKADQLTTQAAQINVTYTERGTQDVVAKFKAAGQAVVYSDTDNIDYLVVGYTADDNNYDSLADDINGLTASIVKDETSSSGTDKSDTVTGVKMSDYLSDDDDGIGFKYPTGWKSTTNDDDMLIIKAPDDSENPYYGMVIETLWDKKGKIAKNGYSDFVRGYEKKILKPVFTQAVKDSSFTYNYENQDIDTDAKIGSKAAIRSVGLDYIYPSTDAVQLSLRMDKNEVTSERLLFDAAGKPAFVNVIYYNATQEKLADEILNSVVAN